MRLDEMNLIQYQGKKITKIYNQDQLVYEYRTNFDTYLDKDLYETKVGKLSQDHASYFKSLNTIRFVTYDQYLTFDINLVPDSIKNHTLDLNGKIFYEYGMTHLGNENNLELFIVTLGDNIYLPDDISYFFSGFKGKSIYFNNNVKVLDNSIVKLAHICEGCTNLNNIDFTQLNIQKIDGDISYMFYDCEYLTTQLTFLNNIQSTTLSNIEYSFYNCFSLELIPLNNFNFNFITNFEGSFAGCSKLYSTLTTSPLAQQTNLFARILNPEIASNLNLTETFYGANLKGKNFDFSANSILNIFDYNFNKTFEGATLGDIVLEDIQFDYSVNQINKLNNLFKNCIINTLNLNNSFLGSYKPEGSTSPIEWTNAFIQEEIFNNAKINTLTAIDAIYEAMNYFANDNRQFRFLVSKIDIFNISGIKILYSCHKNDLIDYVDIANYIKARDINNVFFFKLKNLDIIELNMSNINFPYSKILYESVLIPAPGHDEDGSWTTYTYTYITFNRLRKITMQNVSFDTYATSGYTHHITNNFMEEFLYQRITKAHSTRKKYYDERHQEWRYEYYAYVDETKPTSVEEVDISHNIFSHMNPLLSNCDNKNLKKIYLNDSQYLNLPYIKCNLRYYSTSNVNIDTIDLSNTIISFYYNENEQYVPPSELGIVDFYLDTSVINFNIDKLKFIFNPDEYGYNQIHSFGIHRTWLTELSLNNVFSEIPIQQINFRNNSKLTSITLGNFDTSNIVSFKELVAGCSSLTNLNFLNDFHNSQPIIDTSYMLSGCTNLVDANALNNIDLSQVTDMSYMFDYCQSLIDWDFITNFDTSSVTNMSGMFARIYPLSGTVIPSINLNNFDTSNVTDMSSMFASFRTEGLDISNFDTSNVIDMSSMFSDFNTEGLDISNFDTSNVTNMYGMFSDFMKDYESPEGFNEIIRNFDTSNVTNMGRMFYGIHETSPIDITHFNLNNVNNMSEMFYYTSFTDILLPIVNNNTDSCNLRGMFSSLRQDMLRNLDLSNFNILNPSSTYSMFANSHYLTTIKIPNIHLENMPYYGTISEMFANCDHLRQIILPNFNDFTRDPSEQGKDVKKEIYAYHLFYECSNLEYLNLNNFVFYGEDEDGNEYGYSGREIFAGCKDLRTITVNINPNLNRDLSKLESIYLFHDCTRLQGGNGTSYKGGRGSRDYNEYDEIDAQYAQVDLPDNPGYFTLVAQN